MSDTTQLADAYLLQSSLKTDSPVDVSKGKSVSVIYDNNQGSYNSGLITIDATSQLTDSQGMASLKDGYLLLPYVITAKSTTTTDIATSINRFACAMMTNITNVIDSLCDGSHTHLSLEEAFDALITTDAWRLCCPCSRPCLPSRFRVPSTKRLANFQVS
jgi:hypothetical protein